jgi:hypothetical protein
MRKLLCKVFGHRWAYPVQVWVDIGVNEWTYFCGRCYARSKPIRTDQPGRIIEIEEEEPVVCKPGEAIEIKASVTHEID